MTDEFVPFNSATYWALLGVLLVARGFDFLSTWIATPRLVLEGNPIARHLGWRWGGLVNIVACVGCACMPLAGVVVITSSLLVAARNFQSAWLMRTLGEEAYRQWHLDRLRETSPLLYGLCLLGQTVLMGAVGLALAVASAPDSLAFGIGFGVITYAVAVFVYTLLAVRRLRR